jgi:hypothetical protein
MRPPETEEEIEQAMAFLARLSPAEIRALARAQEAADEPMPSVREERFERFEVVNDTPLERVGVPLQELKDLLAQHGAGPLGRQVNVRVRSGVAAFFSFVILAFWAIVAAAVVLYLFVH